MLVGGGALHAPPALLRGAPPLFDSKIISANCFLRGKKGIETA